MLKGKGSVGDWGSNANASMGDRPKNLVGNCLLAEGKTMKETASFLNTTVRTVAFHKYRIMSSLHLTNAAELVQYAIRHHIINLGPDRPLSK
jgi:FixJ family two-component response regulator